MAGVVTEAAEMAEVSVMADVTEAARVVAKIPDDTIPPDARQFWPEQRVSQARPLVVHHRAGEERGASEVLVLLENAWQQNTALGFREPVPDGGTYEVWIWRGLEEVSVVGADEIPATAWNDAATYMIVDPWGKYGGANLAHTMTHEMNHAFQSRDDWWESVAVYEGSATFVEWDKNGLDELLREVVTEFQRNPAWSLDDASDGDSWYPYGFALYLRFLQHTLAGGDARFLGKAWEKARNRPNEVGPDLLDALEKIHHPRFRYVDSVVSFARWRWYTGARCDDRHDPAAAELASVPETSFVVSAGRRPRRITLEPALRMLGSAYLEVRRRRRGPDSFSVSIDNLPANVRVVVQAVPGLDDDSDGEVVTFDNGWARVRFGPKNKRTLIVTVVPADPDARPRFDPEASPPPTFPLTLSFGSN